MDNPIDRLGLSPLATVDEITAALRERAEDASEEERKRLRETWEELTLHPRTRLRAALSTFPPRPEVERRAADLSPALRPVRATSGADAPSFAPIDVLPRPSVAAALTGKLGPPPPSLAPLESDILVSKHRKGSST
jgi:hypothetical protein